MKKGFWIWTLFCVALIAGLAYLVSGDTVYTGKNITMSSNDARQLTINGTATVEAASSSFFVFKKTSGETLVGTLTPKPLGWESDEYYLAGPTQIQSGTWIIEKGEGITIHLTSQESLTVKEALQPTEQGIVILLLFVLIAIIWLVIGAAFFSK